jgi:hypothetical protein
LVPLLVVGVDGRNGYTRAAGWLGFTRARRAGWTAWTPALLPAATGLGMFGPTPPPGELARSQLREVPVALFGPVAVLRTRASRFSVCLGATVDGGQLLDPGQLNLWVDNWGRWLAGLPFEPQLVAATVTVEAAPDTGATLAAECARLTTPGAPPLAAAMLAEMAATWPATSPSVRTWLTLTWGTARAGRRPASAAEMESLIASRVPNLCATLAHTGAGTVRPLTGEQLIARVRTAFDPSSAGPLAALEAGNQPHGLTWADAGPQSWVVHRDHIEHDGGVSITWRMASAPVGEVGARVLAPLLEAHPGLARKRVTIIYRHHSPHEAARVADADLRTASSRAGERRGEVRATHIADLHRARAVADEQAAGAGLTRISALITATAATTDGLPTAHAIVEQLSQRAQLQVRVATDTQASAFITALGVGVLPTDVTVIPDQIRTAL